jgi:hypothetical protein
MTLSGVYPTWLKLGAKDTNQIKQKTMVQVA